MWISSRATSEMPAEPAPAGDSAAGAPAKERCDCRSDCSIARLLILGEMWGCGHRLLDRKELCQSAILFASGAAIAFVLPATFQQHINICAMPVNCGEPCSVFWFQHDYFAS
jgi:hypothetical protein